MKIYVVIESVDVGPGYIPSYIHGAFKSKEKAEEVKQKISEELSEYIPYWMTAKELVNIEEMELQE